MNHLFDFSDQLCYVQCGFCDTILLVSVPCSSLSMVVTVRCGHCTSLLSVNMMKVTFVPFQHLLASFNSHDDQKEEVSPEVGDNQKTFDHIQRSSSMADNEFEEEDNLVNRVINKPPEKRQRAPSAYNCFIKEEIRRLKAENPSMAHKEAFSTAAKNWANFPPIHCKEIGDQNCGYEEDKITWSFDDAAEVNNEGNCERNKTPRYSFHLGGSEKDSCF
ncbi:Plant-specific transcription factor YABBY family protein [Euphorbia peplus]|nr:Plant-specific transcription factor YABBY family protein [Euphorbia peplus]